MTRLAARTTGAALVVTFVLGGCGGTSAQPSRATPVAVVSGTVKAGPTCPVERVGQPCSPKPFITTIKATVGTRLIASTTSTADGRYHFELPAGDYTISASGTSLLPRCDPKQVNVVAPTDVVVNISCDTGIR
jgi:hypothetical protein